MHGGISRAAGPALQEIGASAELTTMNQLRKLSRADWPHCGTNPGAFAPPPSPPSRSPAPLLRLNLVRTPPSPPPPLVFFLSMPLPPQLHSLVSRTPAVLFFNESRGLSLSG